MEITCSRCHQTVQAGDCYCPVCGLPQLFYAADAPAGQAQPPRWNDAVGDAGTVDWKPAMRAAFLLSIPAGVLSSGVFPYMGFGLFWMATAAGLAVMLYMRSRPAWITLGAGARIGLVTGLLAGWVAFGVSGAALFVQRFLLHQSSRIDSEWSSRVVMGQQLAEQFTSGMTPADAAQAQARRAQFQAWMLSPEGHAGMEAMRLAANAAFLLFFAVAGGALGARLMARTRRPEV
jgi:hypothetical protein